MTSITVAEYLAQRLAEMGIKHIFAVPSDYANGFLSTIDAGTLLQRVGNANELEAGYAADGYARLRGAGAVCVTYGVGIVQPPQCHRWVVCRAVAGGGDCGQPFLCRTAARA